MAMNEGTVNEWLVEEGAQVDKGDIIATVETEKTAYDLESPESGFFHIVLPVGETVDCGTVIGRFADDKAELATLQEVQPVAARVTDPVPPESGASPRDASSDAAPPTATKAPPPASGRVIASPLARKMASDRNMNLTLISGSGPGGAHCQTRHSCGRSRWCRSCHVGDERRRANREGAHRGQGCAQGDCGSNDAEFAINGPAVVILGVRYHRSTRDAGEIRCARRQSRYTRVGQHVHCESHRLWNSPGSDRERLHGRRKYRDLRQHQPRFRRFDAGGKPSTTPHC